LLSYGEQNQVLKLTFFAASRSEFSLIEHDYCRLALLPFLGCSAALAAYMVATLGGAPAPGGDGAAADLTGAAPPVATARAPSYAPTLMVPATGRTPAPVGWEEPAGGDDGHPLGHLRATAAPSASPAATRTTTPAPSAVCARAGVPCPKDKHDCCSGRCEKDEETKEKVCSAEPMTTAAPYASPTAEPSMAPAAEPRTNDPTDDGVPGASLPTDAPVSSSPTVAPAMLTGAPTDACVEAGAPCPADKKDCCSGICTKDKETKEKVCWGTPPPATSPPTAAPSTAAPTVCEAAGAPCPKDKARCCSGGCEKDEETGEKVCGGAAGPGPGPEDRCLVAGEACADKKMCCSGSCKKAKKDNKEKGRARLLKEKVCE